MNFSHSEYASRLAALRLQMQRQQLDLVLYFGQEAANYFGGFYTHGHFANTMFAVPLSGEPFMVLRALEEAAGRSTSWLTELHLFQDHEDPFEIARQTLVSKGLASARIACDTHSWYLTVERYAALKTALPGATFVDEGGIADQLRTVKTLSEIDYLRSASATVDAAMQAAIAATGAGVGERTVAAAMAAARIEAGSDLPIDGVLTTGPRTLQGHGGWTDRVIQAGDPFLYEFHGIVNHYWARSLRSGVVGRANAQQLDIAAKVIQAQDAMIAKLVPGGSSREADAACREVMITSGLKDRAEYTRRLGYSLGINFRPSPGEMICGFTPTIDFEIRAGMTFMLLCSHEGIGIGDMVAVTENGPELLTRLPRKYYELER